MVVLHQKQNKISTFISSILEKTKTNGFSMLIINLTIDWGVCVCVCVVSSIFLTENWSIFIIISEQKNEKQVYTQTQLTIINHCFYYTYIKFNVYPQYIFVCVTLFTKNIYYTDPKQICRFIHMRRCWRIFSWPTLQNLIKYPNIKISLGISFGQIQVQHPLINEPIMFYG